MTDVTDVMAITTTNLDGWIRHGLRMALSWRGRWPVPLTLYSEGFEPAVPGIFTRDLHDVEWLTPFKRQYPYRRPGPYDFRFDAAKFAHKVAAICDAYARRHEWDKRWLIWCDADTFTHADVPPEFVQWLLPEHGESIAWLDRAGPDNKPPLYPECGFVIFDMHHPMLERVMDDWLDLYTSGSVFDLPEWHDSYTLQHVVEGLYKLMVKSLSGDARYTTHPFVNGPLGAYMDHMKGPTRKQAGHSWRADFPAPRKETYWRGMR